MRRASLHCFRARRANPALRTNEGMPNPLRIGRLKQEHANPFTCLSQELDKRLQLLLELLQSGADPLQTSEDGQTCFLSGGS